MESHNIVSKNCRIRHPEYFSIGKYSIIDDFSYFSTKVEVGNCSHIASGCSVAGGKEKMFRLGNFCSLSSGVKIWCSSNDFVNDLVVLKPEGMDIGDAPVEGDVTIGDYCGIGANSVIMPSNNIPDGVSIGALSFVPSNFDFKPWSVYAGNPIKFLKPRNRENVLAQAEKLRKSLNL